MKFFTKDLARVPYAVSYEAFRAVHEHYLEHMETLRPLLSADAFVFFRDDELHDGELLDLQILDGSRPAPPQETPRPWKAPLNHPVKVRLSVLDGWGKTIWHLSYSTVRRVLVDYPSDETLQFLEGGGFGDWLWHELTSADCGFLRHEILFRSGSTLLFEFKEFDVTRSAHSSAAPPPE
jgi:hypothetical protein